MIVICFSSFWCCFQRYLASMEGAILSGKQCAEQISKKAVGREANTGISVKKFLETKPQLVGAAASFLALIAVAAAANALVL